MSGSGRTNDEPRDFYDVVIIGAGLAGLTLARHLLLRTGCSVLLLDKRENPPRRGQKVGESLVQLSGYYLSKVLALEEHLLRSHYLKYNLRFHWPTPTRANTGIEEYGVSFIRTVSTIPTFQLDRNLLEEHLLELNRANPRLSFVGGVQDTTVALATDTGRTDHVVSVLGRPIACRWVVDASGRGGVLKRHLSLAAAGDIRHGATWCWVEGLVDLERLTDRSADQIRIDRRRKRLGNFPQFLATNHFCGEGRWFWVIPLHGKTSLGLVYDRSVVHAGDVASAEQMIEYACREWPLFARDLPQRRILAQGRHLDFGYDARQTISPMRWAMTGEAGRFSDPLYSPGSDLIAIYNSLIVNAIQTDDAKELETSCGLYETIMRVVYQAYVPSYAVSYDCLGDQEAYTLKYTWELVVYFGFYVMPFLNDFFTDRVFMQSHLLKFASLGRINHSLQHFLSGFYQWKRSKTARSQEPQAIEFYDVGWLRESEKMFYEVGLSCDEGVELLDRHVQRLKEFARYIIAHVHASVLGDRRVLLNAPFVSSLKLQHAVFDEKLMRAAYTPFAGATEQYRWNLDPWALSVFLPAEAMTGALA